jgi:predicted Zn finger-like uncharacterized protein
MALMTACPACNTRFKVVPDQLRLHHGLVRCGACDHVFDANKRLESLPDHYVLDPQTQMPAQPPVPSENAWTNKPAVQALVNPSELSIKGEQAWTQLVPPSAAQETTAPTAAQTEQSIDRQSTEHELAISSKPAKLKPKRRLAMPEAPSPDLQPPPAFQAEYVTPSTPTRSVGIVVLAALVTLALLAALTQGLLMMRYVLADQWPSSKPALNSLCKLTGCVLEPAQWLQPLNLDALSLTKLPNASPSAAAKVQAYRMQATVRNSSQLSIQLPDIELTISNAQGQVLAVKTIASRTLNSAPSGATFIAPNSDWLIDTPLQLDEQTVGYTARLVYKP